MGHDLLRHFFHVVQANRVHWFSAAPSLQAWTGRSFWVTSLVPDVIRCTRHSFVPGRPYTMVSDGGWLQLRDILNLPVFFSEEKVPRSHSFPNVGGIFLSGNSTYSLHTRRVERSCSGICHLQSLWKEIRLCCWNVSRCGHLCPGVWTVCSTSEHVFTGF